MSPDGEITWRVKDFFDHHKDDVVEEGFLAYSTEGQPHLDFNLEKIYDYKDDILDFLIDKIYCKVVSCGNPKPQGEPIDEVFIFSQENKSLDIDIEKIFFWSKEIENV